MTTTATQAYESIRQMLWAGELRPGQRVSQSRIARALQCSTVPVVEALRRLESERLLTKEPRKMARVRVLAAAEIEGLFLIRQSIEMVAVRLCTKRCDPILLAELKGLGASFRRNALACSDEAEQCDMDFHLAITRGAGCPVLEEELSRLLLIQRTAPARPRDAAEWKAYAESHHGIVDAIAAADGELAELLMKKHIHAVFQDAVVRAGVLSLDDEAHVQGAVATSIEPATIGRSADLGAISRNKSPFTPF